MKLVNLRLNPEDHNDPRSLVEIIVSRLGGSIKILETYHDASMYRVHDWVYVLSESTSKDRREPWYELKKSLMANKIVYPVEFVTRDEVDHSNGGVHTTDYAEDKMIYFITQYMRHNNSVKAVKKYLAAAGVQIDTIRRNPESGYDAMRDAFRMKGKDDAWIDVRIDGIINRKRFTDVLVYALYDALREGDVGIITNELYIGLWRRTQEILLTQMDLPKKTNLRDHQSRLALLFEAVAEEMCAYYLGQEKGLTFSMACAIVQETAEQVGEFVEKSSARMMKDIPTDIPLMKGYELPQYAQGIPMPKDVKTQRPRTKRWKNSPDLPDEVGE